MADLGSIGTLGNYTGQIQDIAPRQNLKVIHCGHVPMIFGGRDTAEVSSSFRMDSRGTFRFPVVVTPVSSVFAIDVKQAANVSPRPSMVLLQNTGLGILTPVTGTASSSVGWVNISVAVTPSGTGVAAIELRNNYDAQVSGAPCYWNNFTLTRY